MANILLYVFLLVLLQYGIIFIDFTFYIVHYQNFNFIHNFLNCYRGISIEWVVIPSLPLESAINALASVKYLFFFQSVAQGPPADSEGDAHIAAC
jgi:hypothetical protein